mmetsp:Transcript_29531/g.70253  ORF Transcript_29531/g.70253 Transcript_29531/m.70253 type:complete len:233 (-) Transcript_29531:176-874(-)
MLYLRGALQALNSQPFHGAENRMPTKNFGLPGIPAHHHVPCPIQPYEPSGTRDFDPHCPVFHQAQLSISPLAMLHLQSVDSSNLKPHTLRQRTSNLLPRIASCSMTSPSGQRSSGHFWIWTIPLYPLYFFVQPWLTHHSRPGTSHSTKTVVKSLGMVIMVPQSLSMTYCWNCCWFMCLSQIALATGPHAQGTQSLLMWGWFIRAPYQDKFTAACKVDRLVRVASTSTTSASL